MGVVEPSVERLIKGTFLMESQLVDLYDDATKSYGLMMLPEKEVERLYNDYLKFNKRVANKLKKTAYIDFSKSTIKEFKEQLKSNLSFMVAALYIYYNMENQEFPNDDLESIAKFYVKYYVKTDDFEMEREFVEYYKDVF